MHFVRFGKTVLTGLAVLAASTLFAAPPALAGASGPLISGIVNLQGLGEKPLYNRVWAGTTGQSRRREAFIVVVDKLWPVLRVTYQCHVEGGGDTAWMTEGMLCGTIGQSKRLEGFAMKLNGLEAETYSIKY